MDQRVRINKGDVVKAGEYYFLVDRVGSDQFGCRRVYVFDLPSDCMMGGDIVRRASIWVSRLDSVASGEERDVVLAKACAAYGHPGWSTRQLTGWLKRQSQPWKYGTT